MIRESLVSRTSAEETSPEVAQAEPTGWATFRGQIQLTGAPPANPQLDVRGGDAEVCAPNAKKVFAEEVVVGATGGLKNVMVFLTSEISDEEPWTHPSARFGANEPVVFDQKECVFLSHAIGVRVGQEFLIKNSDPIGHNTNVQTKDNLAFNQTIPAGGQAKLVYKKPEKSPVSVSCSIHPWMRANLLVRNNGYFAITDENGEFEIPNLPAGVELEFRIWQEKVGFLSGVQIGDQKVNKGRFLLTLSPNDPGANEVLLELDAAKFN
jgi:plastocyanin